MKRIDEIKQMLKHLLRETEDAINKNYYSDDLEVVKKSAEGVLDNAKRIDEYMTELNK